MLNGEHNALDHGEMRDVVVDAEVPGGEIGPQADRVGQA